MKPGLRIVILVEQISRKGSCNKTTSNGERSRLPPGKIFDNLLTVDKRYWIYRQWNISNDLSFQNLKIGSWGSLQTQSVIHYPSHRSLHPICMHCIGTQGMDSSHAISHIIVKSSVEKIILTKSDVWLTEAKISWFPVNTASIKSQTLHVAYLSNRC